MGSQPIEIAINLCKKFEGFSSVPYICPAGYWTIGYGSTIVDGKRVDKDTSPIDESRAEYLLRNDLAGFLVSVYRLCPSLVAETAERVAAILDFTYNLGSSRLKTSTLRRRINSGDWDDVPRQLRRWVFGGGRKLPGLVKRREAEIGLFT